jgi:ATP-binding cassette, subfamily C, bacterial CydCD
MTESPVTALLEVPRRTLVALSAAGAARAIGLVLLASGLAEGIVAAVAGRVDGTALVVAALGAVVRGASVLVTRRIASAAATRTKHELRRRLLAAVLGRARRHLGADSVLATRALDDLDDYHGTYLPALVEAAIVPLLVGVRILAADWLSAAMIVLTVPLIPIFMTLIGMHTRDRVSAASDALSRLSDHLVELARGLPVLVGLGRLEQQSAALRAISDEHARRSGLVLRTAFLSALALELIGTIAVALVAVVIGLRLLAGDLSLATGLTVLLLAPECFGPLRDVGAAFHQAQDGREAERRVRDVVEATAPSHGVTVRAGRWATALRVDGLTIAHAGRPPIVCNLSFAVPAGRIVLLGGASGGGKSSVLDVLAGRGALLDPESRVDGRIDRSAAVALVPQHPEFAAPTMRAELLAFGARDDAVAHLLDAVGLGGFDAVDPARCSPGEQRRLAMARVLARAGAGARLVLLDEPTAHLDEASARAVRGLIVDLAERAAVVIASHDPETAALADRVVPLDDAAIQRAAEHPSPPPAPRQAGRPDAQQPTHGRAVALLLAVLGPITGRTALAVLLQALAASFAVALLTVSGWLIVRAADEPSIALLTVAMVGVRFFGIGRAALQYAERLATHAAAFGAAGALRARLWTGLARLGPASRALLTPGAALQFLVADADRVRDLLPRTVVPIAAGALTGVGAVVAAWLLDPAAGVVVLVLAAAVLVVSSVAARLVARLQRMADRDRGVALRTTTALLAAADDLVGNGVASPRIELAVGAAATADRGDARVRRIEGAASAFVATLCGLAAVVAVMLAVRAVAAGVIAPAAVGAIALLPIGLVPVFDAVLVAATRVPRLLSVLERLEPLVGTAAEPDRVPQSELASLSHIGLEDLAVRYPAAHRPVFEHVSASVARGGRLVVTGPSGTGKSTLLAVLLRYLEPDRGTLTLDGTAANTVARSSVRRRIAWAPQEGHLFDSSLRGNLLLARDPDDRPTDDELLQTLRDVGLDALLAALPAGLDTPVGPRGGFLSGGERQRVAVARTVLARADAVLLDEPTAHLDRAAADALIADLDRALADRISVLVTHDASLVRPTDARVDLGDVRSGCSRPDGSQPEDAGSDSARIRRICGLSRQAASAATATAALTTSVVCTPRANASGAASTWPTGMATNDPSRS